MAKSKGSFEQAKGRANGGREPVVRVPGLGA